MFELAITSALPGPQVGRVWEDVARWVQRWVASLCGWGMM